MTAHQSAASPPDERADRAPLHRGRRRPAERWIVHGVTVRGASGGRVRPAAATGRPDARRRGPAARWPGSALTGRAFLASFGFAAGDLLFDLLSLDLVFLALRYQPAFGPLAVAYLRLRLRPGDDGKRKGKGKPAAPQAGRPHSGH